jgi:hypothetical protein
MKRPSRLRRSCPTAYTPAWTRCSRPLGHSLPGRGSAQPEVEQLRQCDDAVLEEGLLGDERFEHDVP